MGLQYFVYIFTLYVLRLVSKRKINIAHEQVTKKKLGGKKSQNAESDMEFFSDVMNETLDDDPFVCSSEPDFDVTYLNEEELDQTNRFMDVHLVMTSMLEVLEIVSPDPPKNIKTPTTQLQKDSDRKSRPEKGDKPAVLLTENCQQYNNSLVGFPPGKGTNYVFPPEN